MSVTANFYLSENPVHNRVIRAFYEGCPEKKSLRSFEDYEPSDVAVVFGVYKSRVPVSFPRGKIISQQRKNNLDVIVLETGYINRGDGENHHYAAGFNGLNGRADSKNHGAAPDRAEKLGVKLKPWKTGENIILCGQVPWDASVDHINILSWLVDAVENIGRESDRPIYYRPHPLAKTIPIGGTLYSTEELLADLSDAHCCVTFNSNSAVEAAIEGVPVFAFDEGSMALPIANTQWSKIENPDTPSRERWLNELAYCQWTPDEMRAGLAWKHLFR